MTNNFESLSDSATLAAAGFSQAAGQLQRASEGWQALAEALDSGDAARIADAANAVPTLDLPENLRSVSETFLASAPALETVAAAELDLQGVAS